MSEYAQKKNRNGFTYTNATIEALKKRAFLELSKVNADLKEKNRTLTSILSGDEVLDTEIEAFLSSVNYAELKQTKEYFEAKKLLIRIMDEVSSALSSNWDNHRYSREIIDE